MNVSHYRQASGVPFHVSESSMPHNKTCNAERAAMKITFRHQRCPQGCVCILKSFSGHHVVKKAHVEGWFPGMLIA